MKNFIHDYLNADVNIYLLENLFDEEQVTKYIDDIYPLMILHIIHNYPEFVGVYGAILLHCDENVFGLKVIHNDIDLENDEKLQQAFQLSINEFKQLNKPLKWISRFCLGNLNDVKDHHKFIADTDLIFDLFKVKGEPKGVLSQASLKNAPKAKESMKNICAMSDGNLRELYQELATLILAQIKYYCGNNIDEDMINRYKIDENIMLAAILGCKELLIEISDVFNVQPHEVQFPERVYQYRETLRASVQMRTYEAAESQGSMSWFKDVSRNGKHLRFDSICKDLILSCVKENSCSFSISGSDFLSVCCTQKSDVFQEFIHLNMNSPKSALQKSQLIKQFKNSCRERLIGQDNAIDAVSRGLLTSITTKTIGLLNTFTFLGPSGVGKTELAYVISEEVERLFNTGYKMITFNMENYSDAKDASRLFGSGSQYADSQLGLLTTEVRAQVRSIILIDEIEKAHPTVQQSLLTVIDKGAAKDNTDQATVDFSQCIFIFTSNLGQSKISNEKLNYSPLDLLQDGSKNALSPEFVNRLGKGEICLFNKMSALSLTKLWLQLFFDDQNLVESVARFHWPYNGAMNILKCAASLTPRCLMTLLPKVKADILNNLSENIVENPLGDTSNEDALININVTFADEPFKDLSIGVLSDNKAIQNTSVKLLSSYDELKNSLHFFDVLVIDKHSLSKLNIDKNSLAKLLKNESIITVFTEVNYFDSLVSFTKKSSDIEMYYNDFNDDFLNKVILVVRIFNETKRLINEGMGKDVSYEYEIFSSGDENNVNVLFSPFISTPQLKGDDVNLPYLTVVNVDAMPWDRIYGNKHNIDTLKVLANAINKNEKKLLSLMPKNYIFSGQSGTGKSYVISTLFSQLEITKFKVDATQLTIGDTEKNISELFQAIRKYSPCALCIENLDLLTTSTNSSGLAFCTKSLMNELDDMVENQNDVYIFGTVKNAGQLISECLNKGRFESVLQFDLPGKLNCSSILTTLIAEYELNLTDKSFELLVGFFADESVSEMDSIVRRCALWQLQNADKDVNNEIANISLNTLMGPVRDDIELDENQRKSIAYHEAAHYVVTKLTDRNSKVLCLSIIPRRSALGFMKLTEFRQSVEQSRKLIKSKIKTLLAGRAGEKIYFDGNDDLIGLGSISDIRKATEIAKKAIYIGGISNDISLVDYSQLDSSKSKVDGEIQSFLSQCQSEVEALLQSNQKYLKSVAEILYQKGTLFEQELDFISNKYLSKPIKTM